MGACGWFGKSIKQRARAIDGFKLDFDAAIHHDSSIARRYPELTTFVRTRSTVAQRGVATKRKNEATKNSE